MKPSWTKKDKSLLLYEKYFGLKNRSIEIFLFNGQSIRGTIIGFYKNSYSTPCIYRWHLLPENEKATGRYDPFGIERGVHIFQKDIVWVYFLEDKSIIVFH